MEDLATAEATRTTCARTLTRSKRAVSLDRDPRPSPSTDAHCFYGNHRPQHNLSPRCPRSICSRFGLILFLNFVISIGLCFLAFQVVGGMFLIDIIWLISFYDYDGPN